MPDAPSTQSKYWCFTLNNPTEAETTSLGHLVADTSNVVTFLLYGRERGESGTPHLQGYLELSRRARLTAVKRLIGIRCHLERRRGTQQEATVYCQKEDQDPVQYGIKSIDKSGERNDLKNIQQLILSGTSELDIANDYFSRWIVYRRSFERYRQLNTPNGIRPQLRVYVLWGEAGTGKTRYVYEKYPDLFSVPDSSLKWFDGYNGESTVLIDDYRGDGEDCYILKVLDIYPLKVPVKGDFTEWRPDRIFLTSNLDPSLWHSNVYPALARRIHKTIKFEGPMGTEEISELLDEGEIEQ